MRRIIEAADQLGDPFSGAEKAVLLRAMESPEAPEAAERMQSVLDGHCLFTVSINPEMRVRSARGAAAAELVEQGWRRFLVKVVNEAGTTAPLRITSPNAGPVSNAQSVQPAAGPQPHEGDPKAKAPPSDPRELWLDVQSHDAPPMQQALSGLSVEYRIVSLYSRDAGKREARFTFDAGQGTQDLGYRNEADVLFNCLPARAIALRVRDEAGEPATASFVIRDGRGRVYPLPAKRLAPDFPFHPQIYREDGGSVRLPDGDYDVEFARGPESVPEKRRVTVGPETKEMAFQVRRWIDPAKLGWWSGDHHIHTAGCAHYSKPTEGVHAPDMARHCRGEDLKIGANLTWGPCFDYQKQFFTGHEDGASRFPYLLRYDVEVSGFGSHRSGHLCLLRLREQMYPGGESMAHWPTLGLNTLRWAQKQGAVCGPAHSGNGLRSDTRELPNYVIPPFDGIGANEYIVDVTHEVPGPDGHPVPAVDFMSAVDTDPVSELNIWYHTLNAGFRTRISGETDFPCITGERVGLGRSYVRVEGKLTYDAWCQGIAEGRCYVSDGKSHLLNFAVNGLGVGEKESEVRLAKPGTVKVTVEAAALLGDRPGPLARMQSSDFWDLERARINGGREVAVELILNGLPVQRRVIAADGALRGLSFEVPVERSGWVALRIFPSSHTNPVFVPVEDKPVRASRRSLEWCLACVDRCWSQKQSTIAPGEMGDAVAAYEHARATYRRRLAEAGAD
ncbi:MAG: hypothetical protein EOP86_11725 [Verrucomicrobiaceae bacterium]|nr:MAG: hypothetical protein EOP86_11725 [Verrucomicrobiaceae bacterium]